MQVIVSISMDRNDAGEIVLCIGDDGVGIGERTDLRLSETLGVQTVFNLVEHQLLGSITYFDSDGLKWMITFRDAIYRARV
jgi:two-component sensor histidine kinase